MRPIRVIALALPVLVLASFSFPRTVLLPGAHGFREIAPRVWMQPGARDPVEVLNELDWAETRIEEWWGGATERPRILICGDTGCDGSLGGVGPYAQAYDQYLLILHSRLSTEAADLRRAIIAHELSHAALASRVSSWRLLTGDMPAWLNEGLAVLASDDPRFDLTPERCALLADETLPESMRDWDHAAGQRDRPIYQAAACRARDWLATNALSDL
ncbi:hypothetical protein [Jannaschia helgolandensis]|nr:hypothetical protein [Jannaschia helgolandensis]